MGGLGELKRWLRERKRAFSEEARSFGSPIPRGLLLLGVQGCGKSLSAKSVAREWHFPLLRLDLAATFGGGEASPEATIREATLIAESIAPAILWIDEIEKGLAIRVLGSFLTWLSEKTAPVFVVATANDVAGLPPELLRRGRFDDLFFVDLPTQSERAEVLSIHLARHGRDPLQFDLEQLRRRVDEAEASSCLVQQATKRQQEAEEEHLAAKRALQVAAEQGAQADQIRDELATLRELTAGVEALDAAQRILVGRTEAFRRAARVGDEAVTALQQMRAEAQERDCQRAAAAGKAERTEPLREEINAIQRQLTLHQQLERGQKLLGDEQRGLDEIESQLDAVRRDAVTFSQEVRALEKGWLSGQAAQLASRLEQGALARCADRQTIPSRPRKGRRARTAPRFGGPVKPWRKRKRRRLNW